MTSVQRWVATRLVVAMVLLGFASPGAAACGASCCASMPSGHGPERQPSPACCCGHAPIPCDFHEDLGGRVPDAAVGAASFFPSVHVVGIAPLPLAPVPPAGPLGPERIHPSGASPPADLYLRNVSFLC